MQIAQDTLDRLLSQVEKPGRYAGGEWNSVVKDWDQVGLTIALGYPDIYEIGMSNLGLAILYEIVNQRADLAAERFYLPWHDMTKLLRRADLPLFSLESRHALADFDLIGFSLQHELNHTNVLEALDLAGLPLRAAQRTADMPLVMAGGSCAFSPEPMAPFFDLFVIGDGERAILEVADTMLAWKREHAPHTGERAELLVALAQLQGVYVPSLYRPSFASSGVISAFERVDSRAPTQVTKALVPTLTQAPLHPIVPTIRVIHDRGAVEIQRGCSHGCRFCQAGMIYRPIRERPTAETLATIDQVIANTGNDEIGLVSLSSSDHSGIAEIVTQTMSKYADRRLSVSLPSLRIDSFSVKLAETIQQSRKTGFTFAPEAGSQRLRDVINKGVTEADLVTTAEALFAAGWDRIKLYFMIGLPTETDEDISEMARLINTIWQMGRRERRRRAKLRVSVSTFVPKAFTPFQWEPLADRETIERRQNLLRDMVDTQSIQLSWSDWETTWLEAIFSRGDRRLADVVERAWQLGAQFDAWEESFQPKLWAKALAECQLDGAWYTTRRRAWDEHLPWELIDAGVSQAFLQLEAQRALSSALSPDCRQTCHSCGILQAFADEHDAVPAATWGCP